MNKLILTALLAVNFFGISVHARWFEVFVRDGNLKTLDNAPVQEYQVIDIKGQYPDGVEIPTYGQIRKSVAESFNLDPHWKNFTIKFGKKSNGKFYYLKPHIEKLSRKDRAAFLDEIAKEGYKGMPALILAKREMKSEKQVTPIRYEGKVPSDAITPQIGVGENDQEMRIMPISMEEEMTVPPAPTDMPPAPKIYQNREEDMIVPEWLFDETLVGESDPELLRQLRHAELMYGQ